MPGIDADGVQVEVPISGRKVSQNEHRQLFAAVPDVYKSLPGASKQYFQSEAESAKVDHRKRKLEDLACVEAAIELKRMRIQQERKEETTLNTKFRPPVVSPTDITSQWLS